MARSPVHARRQPMPTEPLELSEEVVAFQVVQQELHDLREQFPEVFAELDRLAELYKATLEAAQKIVAARGTPEGPFQVHQIIMNYDGDKLFELVHGDLGKFKEYGGELAQKVAYKVNRVLFDSLAAQQRIPPEIIQKVRTRRVTFRHVPELLIP